MRFVKPKKALGQHFLKDLQIAHRIADTLAEYKGTPVLEIGQGMGVFTQFLLEAEHDLKEKYKKMEILSKRKIAGKSIPEKFVFKTDIFVTIIPSFYFLVTTIF